MGQHRYTKKEAISIVVSCAEAYRNELEGRSILLLCTDKHKNLIDVEFTFAAENYLHLTGLKVKGRYPNTEGAEPTEGVEELTAKDFYRRCLAHKLSANDFEMAEDGTTDMKLDVLPSLICKNLSASMVGDFNGQKPKLVTDKLAGGVKACIGFVKDGSGVFVPNTVLKEDIRFLINGALRVVAVLRKRTNEQAYEEITYVAKKVDWERISPPEYLKALWDIVQCAKSNSN